MSNVYGLMREHLGSKRMRRSLESYLGVEDDRSLERFNENEPVITPRESVWRQVSEDGVNKLACTFSFDTHENMSTFLRYVLQYEDETAHHGKHLIEARVIRTQVWTHMVNDITSVDRDYARTLLRFYEMSGG